MQLTVVEPVSLCVNQMPQKAAPTQCSWFLLNRGALLSWNSRPWEKPESSRSPLVPPWVSEGLRSHSPSVSVVLPVLGISCERIRPICGLW